MGKSNFIKNTNNTDIHVGLTICQSIQVLVSTATETIKAKE